MKKNFSRAVWWSLFAAYTAFIFASLAYLPGVTNRFFYRYLAGGGTILIYVAYAIIFLIGLWYVYSVKKEASGLRLFLFFIFSFLLAVMIDLAPYPAEKLHVAEYGLSAVIAYNALRLDFDRFGKKLYVYAALLVSCAGALDETIQAFLPNRVFQWQDIALNVASGILVLLVIRINILNREG